MPYKDEATKRAASKRRYERNKKNGVNKIRIIEEYGITYTDYLNMLKVQGGKCPICDRQFTVSLKPNIDHCHVSGRVRGLLCGGCNRGLGQFQDRAYVVERAAAYLKKHWQNVLDQGPSPS